MGNGSTNLPEYKCNKNQQNPHFFSLMIILYYIILYYIILYYIILYCIILYYIILYYITSYYIQGVSGGIVNILGGGSMDYSK